ncbi:MAG: SAM-dependent methyltransferase [Phycisphaerales bacterium]
MAQGRQLHDKYFKQAKAEGYAARSAYKLKQICQKRPLLRRGDAVLDLGCAPGSWMQVASELVGARGIVVGLDLQPVDVSLPQNAKALQGDVFHFDPAALTALLQAPAAPATSPGTSLARLFDAVISDMAPNTTGDGDHFRSVELCRRVLTILPALLKVGGNLTMKVFEGEQYPALLAETRAAFRDVKGFKPDATRGVSKEMYIIALGYTGRLGDPA